MPTTPISTNMLKDCTSTSTTVPCTLMLTSMGGRSPPRRSLSWARSTRLCAAPRLAAGGALRPAVEPLALPPARSQVLHTTGSGGFGAVTPPERCGAGPDAPWSAPGSPRYRYEPARRGSDERPNGDEPGADRRSDPQAVVGSDPGTCRGCPRNNLSTTAPVFTHAPFGPLVTQVCHIILRGGGESDVDRGARPVSLVRERMPVGLPWRDAVVDAEA